MFVLNLQRKLMAQGNVQWLFHAFKWEEWAHGLNPEPFKLVFEGPQGRQPRRLRGSWFSQGPIRKTEDTPSNILKRNFTQGIDYKGHGRTKTSRRDSETTKRLSEQEALPPPPHHHHPGLEAKGRGRGVRTQELGPLTETGTTVDLWRGWKRRVMEEQQRLPWPILSSVLQSPTGAP